VTTALIRRNRTAVAAIRQADIAAGEKVKTIGGPLDGLAGVHSGMSAVGARSF
jgi:hypothetical protein